MIRAEFCYHKGQPASFRISGHAGYAESGKDIVCAAVSACTEMAVNGITEIVKTKCGVEVGEDSVELILQENARPAAWHFVSALRLELQNLAQDHPGTVNLIISEV
ncbi:MAG TPA: ribosomal-processing cysteine protease Prp [Oscillospiraceae bacterium]|nr:ribosomal-processing cysteine protease Prp [Oscillospiraceae bacterium]HXK78129.1 ribosomal-processing cysteine protease Prp [Oscillospiraceae bacterium]